MDKYTATELAYKNGYTKGYEEGKASLEVKHGYWIKPTKVNGRNFAIYHCSVCEGVPCGIDENTHYCPNCGAKMVGKE